MGISPVLDLSPEDTVRFERARRFLSPWGMKIDEATMEYVQARQLLSDVSIMDAAKFYRGFFPVNNDNRNVRDLVDEFIEFKEPVCSPSYIKDLRNRLGRFAEALQCPLVMLTPAKMKAYFDSFNETSARNYNNTRGAIGTFLKYCQRREYLPGDIDLLKKIDVRKEVREEVKIFSPDEYTRMLKGASSELLPMLVLGGLCGLRTAEIRRLDWSRIDWHEKYVGVPGRVAKTGERRIAPIAENALL